MGAIIPSKYIYEAYQALTSFFGSTATYQPQKDQGYDVAINLYIEHAKQVKDRLVGIKESIEAHQAEWSKEDLMNFYNLVSPIYEALQHLQIPQQAPSLVHEASAAFTKVAGELLQLLSDLIWDNLLSNKDVLFELAEKAQQEDKLDIDTLCNPE